ncbi:MAG: radical SAM protein [Bacilli bacterium]
MFNAYRRGLHQVDESVVFALDCLVRGEQNWDAGLAEEFRRTLIESGYVVDDEFDEHQVLLKERESMRLSEVTVALTIAPTIDCNFACPYCFEGGDKPQLRMSSATMDAVVHFARSQITEATQRLAVTWFGGEPLLGLKQIEEMTAKLKEQIVDQRHLQYDASIVTNGYGLTRKIAERLRDLGVSHAQITLDGTAEHHNRRRFRKGGDATFDRIVQNIVASRDLLKISIRVNVDSENRESFTPLVKYLYEELELRDQVRVYPAMMRDDGSETWGKAYSCMSDYTADQVALHREAVQHGVRVLNYPQAMRLYCGASKPTFWVVSPTGDLHKCWNTINDPSRAVGNVNTQSVDADGHDQWLQWSPFQHEKCRQCSVMPLCMGGCPHHAFQQGGDPQCDQWKFGLQESIEVWVQDRMQATAQQASLNPSLASTTS